MLDVVNRFVSLSIEASSDTDSDLLDSVLKRLLFENLVSVE